MAEKAYQNISQQLLLLFSFCQVFTPIIFPLSRDFLVIPRTDIHTQQANSNFLSKHVAINSKQNQMLINTQQNVTI
jgi:hypothetical protein